MAYERNEGDPSSGMIPDSPMSLTSNDLSETTSQVNTTINYPRDANTASVATIPYENDQAESCGTPSVHNTVSLDAAWTSLQSGCAMTEESTERYQRGAYGKACDECATRKVKCEGPMPCKRCRSTETPCVRDRLVRQLKGSKKATPSLLVCTACRRARTECDRTKPCGICLRLERDCKYGADERRKDKSLEPEHECAERDILGEMLLRNLAWCDNGETFDPLNGTISSSLAAVPSSAVSLGYTAPADTTSAPATTYGYSSPCPSSGAFQADDPGSLRVAQTGEGPGSAQAKAKMRIERRKRGEAYACDSCAEHKARCDGRDPCKRCEDRARFEGHPYPSCTRFRQRRGNERRRDFDDQRLDPSSTKTPSDTIGQETVTFNTDSSGAAPIGSSSPEDDRSSVFASGRLYAESAATEHRAAEGMPSPGTAKYVPRSSLIACDRCAGLKRKCKGADQCTPCQKRHLQCTFVRAHQKLAALSTRGEANNKILPQTAGHVRAQDEGGTNSEVGFANKNSPKHYAEEVQEDGNEDGRFGMSNDDFANLMLKGFDDYSLELDTMH